MTDARIGATAPRPWILALDTATGVALVAAGTMDGAVIGTEGFAAGQRHSQELLPAVTRLLQACSLRLVDARAVVVGTGPGAFTGLRVGLATAKTLSHELGIPIVGIPSGEALLAAAAEAHGGDGALALWLPAGPQDVVVVESGEAPRRVSGADVPGPDTDDARDRVAVVAVDLDGRASAEALARGALALERLPAALLRLGAARLRAGEHDDPERLVPEYVTLPRGIVGGLDVEGGVAWSRDPR